MITPEHKKIIEEVAMGYAKEMFKDMQDSNMRGPKFRWEKFPELVARIVRVSVFLAFSDEEFQEHYKDYAEQKAREYAEELLKTKKGN